MQASDEKTNAPTVDNPFTIVGVGASAGGLAAFEVFFSGMPANYTCNMAFILIQHLAPDHKSILPDLIRRYTQMQVFEVEDGMMVQPNCVYIIPPNYNMAILNGTLQLLEPFAPRGLRMPIDFFFRSLAQDQRERAIGIILSGTGSDGTLGIRAIKGEAGMVMIQKPESSEFNGMLNSALATGLVDFELPPAEMMAKLISYTQHAFGKVLPDNLVAGTKNESALNKIFILLRTQTGHDFSQYKPNTLLRRIERRMSVHQIETMEEYVKYLQHTPVEIEALFRDILIGVTHFFRDVEAFSIFEKDIIPKLFTDKPATGNGVIRVWSTGCSTGEEAYSIAILLQEYIETLKQNYTIQVFATDIDARAIATARTGLYPASIASDISPERLSRFFTIENDGSHYRVHKNIRDKLIFSEQNLIKDPPFSKLDLISCRNLLIYLNQDLQKKIIPLFHYALNPGGILFLGNSEGIGDFTDLFTVLDRKAKLYQKKEHFNSKPYLTAGNFFPSLTSTEISLPRLNDRKSITSTKRTLREITEHTLLTQVNPVAALVSAQDNILYLHGRTGMYLEPAPGESNVNNILKMAREGLRSALSMALQKAKSTNEVVHIFNIHIKTNAHITPTNLSIYPIRLDLDLPPGLPLYLVVFKEISIDLAEPKKHTPSKTTPDASDLSSIFSSHTDEHIQALEEELRVKEEFLQSTHEELESSNEELKSSNEEMQSVNEELQSTNEELETSKEELQSVNEELATVNTELNTKVIDLSRINNDMNNLLAGTGIATIFVDHKLHILRFTPTAAQIINLIPNDMGRPVSHIVSNLTNYTTLVADVQAVLNTLVSQETQVQTIAGMWYTMRIRPYRTLDNTIEGAVITFVDITEIMRAREALLENEKFLYNSQKIANLGSYVTDFAKDTWKISPEIYKIFGIDETSSRTLKEWSQLLHPSPAEKKAEQNVEADSLAHSLNERPKKRFSYEAKIKRISDEKECWIYGVEEIEYDAQANPIRAIGTIQDITDRRPLKKML